MSLQWPAALLALLGLSSCVPNAQRQYEMQPALPFLFQWKSPRMHCDPIPPGARAYPDVRPSTPNNVHRLDELVLSRQQLPELSLSVQSSLTSIEGGDRSDYSVRLCAEAGAQTEAEANRLLEQIKLTAEGNTLTLVTPQGSAQSRPSAHLRVQAPADVPVTINGTYAALAVRGINAPVKLTTTHARITVLDTTGDVEATASEFGIVDFSGSRGHVRLQAATEININIPVQHFDGTLEAVAERPVRVLLPPGFASPFEAVVKLQRDFVCRANICGEIKRTKRDGQVLFTFGSGEPLLRFRSLSGPVVIDSTDRLPAHTDAHQARGL